MGAPEIGILLAAAQRTPSQPVLPPERVMRRTRISRRFRSHGESKLHPVDGNGATRGERQRGRSVGWVAMGRIDDGWMDRSASKQLVNLPDSKYRKCSQQRREYTAIRAGRKMQKTTGEEGRGRVGHANETDECMRIPRSRWGGINNDAGLQRRLQVVMLGLRLLSSLGQPGKNQTAGGKVHMWVRRVCLAPTRSLIGVPWANQDPVTQCPRTLSRHAANGDCSHGLQPLNTTAESLAAADGLLRICARVVGVGGDAQRKWVLCSVLCLSLKSKCRRG